MLHKIRPLAVRMSFDDRPYSLGQEINLVVEVASRGDAEVREGRVDLWCDQRYTDVFTVMVPTSRPVPPTRGVYTHLPTLRVPKRVAEERKATYLVASAPFLENSQVASGTVAEYPVRIEIPSEPPPRSDRAQLRWRVSVTLDVAYALDAKTQYDLQVVLE